MSDATDAPQRRRAPSLPPPVGTPGPSRPQRLRPMTPGVSSAARVRAYVAGAVLSLGLGGVAYKAYGLQVTDAAKWQAEAERQHVMTLQLSAPRGEIIDVHGRALAVTADADSVWANPREIVDVAATADKLAKLVGTDVGALEGKLAADKRFAWVARQVTPEVAAAVKAAAIPGVVVTREPRRWYPGGGIGGTVIGRANIDGEGLDGIELAMNDVLTGTRASAPALRDAHGHAAMADGLIAAEAGATVQLTLDRTIQAIADDALLAAVTSHQARSGSVVVLDVATGEVLAMSSVPSYDPNEGPAPAPVTKAGKPVKQYEGPRNRSITDAYEIGSLMKLFTVAAALDAGVTRADEWWDLGNGTLSLAGGTVHDVHHDPSLTTSGIIKRSSNVGAAKIGMRLGREKLGAALQRFGFAGKSGIELPGERAGSLRDPSTWRDIELATISFGYGLTVTPLQVAAGVATMGNGGVYHEPRIVKTVTSADGEVVYRAAPATRQAMKARTAAAMLPMMASVFEKGKQGGTAKDLEVPGFHCGGKTGTAHKFDPALRGYAPDKYLSSFVGLAPVDAPRIAVVVLIDEPSGGDYFGGKVAGPVFATVVSDTLRYLGVPGQAIVVPAPTAADAAKATAAGKHTVAPAASVDASADADDAADDSAAITGGSDAGVGGIPDLRGLGLRQALDRAQAAGIELTVQGSGRVVDQLPAPGLPGDGGAVTIILSEDRRGRPRLTP